MSRMDFVELDIQATSEAPIAGAFQHEATLTTSTASEEQLKNHVGEPAPRSRKTGILLLLALALGVITSRTIHTLLGQAFKTVLGTPVVGGGELRVPILIAFLEVSSFPIPLLFWMFVCWMQKGKVTIENPRYRLKMYALIAATDMLATAMSSISLSVLPAAVYTIIKSSSVAISVILSRLFTRKQFNIFHYTGALMVVMSVSIASVLQLSAAKAVKISSNDVSTYETIVAVIVCVSAAFCSSLLSVLGYKLFVHEGTKGQLTSILELNAMQGTLMFVFFLPLLSSSEVDTWPTLFEYIRMEGKTGAFVALCIGMLLTKPLTWFSNMGVVACSSPTLGGILGGPRRLFIIVLAFLIFNESISSTKLISVTLLCIALAIYAYGGHVLQKQKRANKTICTSATVEVLGMKQ